MTNIDKLKALDKHETASVRYVIAAIAAWFALLVLIGLGYATDEMVCVLVSVTGFFVGMSLQEKRRARRLMDGE